MQQQVDRWAWVDIDLDAIAHNIGVIRGFVAPTPLVAVVKANAYGHGAVPVANTAVDAGASALAVALTHEGIELREAGIDSTIYLFSEQPPEHAAAIVHHRLIPVVYSEAAVHALADHAPQGYPVQVKVDTGMHRVGTQPDETLGVIRAIERAGLTLAGVFTHLAVADEPANPYTTRQLALFDRVLGELAAAGVEVPFTHAANSAAALEHRAARLDAVRVGIAMYGIAPGPEVEALTGELRAAMSLRARVSHVKRVAAGERISYGLRHTFARDTTVATVPLGYADGVARRLSDGGEVLIGGRRYPLVGVVTMDQCMVDVGPLDNATPGGAGVAVGDEVVLIGRQGTHEITADEWAARLGTIPYEIVCAISARVPRRYHPTVP
jgi:alanine racemase